MRYSCVSRCVLAVRAVLPVVEGHATDAAERCRLGEAWALSMQNHDGGWSALVRNCGNWWLEWTLGADRERHAEPKKDGNLTCQEPPRRVRVSPATRPSSLPDLLLNWNGKKLRDFDESKTLGPVRAAHGRSPALLVAAPEPAPPCPTAPLGIKAARPATLPAMSEGTLAFSASVL